MSTRTDIDESWLGHLETQFEMPYMKTLKQFLVDEKAAGKVIYPAGPLIFNALNSLPLHRVKVVIIGQDPYHGEGQAHGLSFSVAKGVRIPPSLRNIYSEVENSTGQSMPAHGCLDGWVSQGVLLLNATLTVEQSNAGSHQKKGWETFTDAVIDVVNEQCEHVVFLLWGGYAQKKGQRIDTHKHCVLKSVHPSPLSAYRGFLGCNHFVETNEYLAHKGLAPIDWGYLP